MKELRTEIEINAPAAKVWAILTDLGQYAAWNPFMPEAVGEVKEGERLRVRIAPPGGKAMTFTPTVTLVEPERAFRWLGRLLLPGIFDGEHIYEITPLSEGSIRFVQRENFRGILVPLFWKSLDTQTRQGFEAMNAALKQRAEGGRET